ncbi:MAG: protein kinase [Gemmatimonadaceae bacterium]|nr:protein kinase [Gemmatimonadaceae bacterium]
MTAPTPSPTPSLGASSPAERAWSQVEDALRTTLIGEYEIRGLIGRGGMAAVYLADELVLDRKVAIKVMSPALVYGDGMVDRFRREAKTIAGLSHPHIIPLHRVVERGDVLAIIMKFINGRPLDSIIAETGPMPIAMVHSIVAQVSAALAYAHRKGVVHRDIKPANIMIDDDGTAVVCDFGIAKAAGVETPLTMTGATVGTPRYMSPEQWAGEGITGSADQYSLGVVAFEMLTGEPPFGGGSVMDVMAAHLHQPAPKVETIRRDVPPALAQVINRMLAKAPADRFPSLDTVARTLDRAEAAQDEAVRSQLMTLATSGDRHRRMEAMLRQSVPVSPIPASRSSTAVPTGPRGVAVAAEGGAGRRPMLRWAGVASVVAVVSIGAWMAGRPAPAIETPPSRPDTSTSAGSAPPVADPQPVERPPVAPPIDTASNVSSSATNEKTPTSNDQRKNKGAGKPTTTNSGPVVVAKDTASQRPVEPVQSPPVASEKDSTVPAVAPPSPPPALASIRIGTRDQNDVLYVNGAAQTPMSGLRTIKLPPGVPHTLSVRANGCVPWDTTITLTAGQSVPLNYKKSECP